MTMHSAIRVSNLSKKYIIGGQEKGYRTFREAVFDAILSPLQGLRSHLTREEVEQNEFWALRDVSFDIPQGEIVGIIGRNGAGKSTLLKVLSKITEPTSGKVEIRGRVGSLLEVGTGFHPELTGRENIYMNGSILGMQKAEITRKFDEIVAFSEIEKFLDTPVKRYSSGMYVRLAFAVAAHLEPEILIIDEVLAVGDIAFQKKCLGKMKDVGQEGRTVLFVSHNMQAVSDLCKSAFLFENGTIIDCGDAKRVVNTYVNLGANTHQSRRDLCDLKIRNTDISNPTSIFKWTDIFILNSKGECKSEILFGEPFEIIFRGNAREECENVRIGFAISTKYSGILFCSHQLYNGLPDILTKGISEFRVRMEPNFLAPTYYEVGISADGTAKVADHIMNNAISFSISDVPYDHKKQWRTAINSGILYYPCTWHLNVLESTGKEIR